MRGSKVKPTAELYVFPGNGIIENTCLRKYRSYKKLRIFLFKPSKMKNYGYPRRLQKILQKSESESRECLTFRYIPPSPQTRAAERMILAGNINVSFPTYSKGPFGRVYTKFDI